MSEETNQSETEPIEETSTAPETAVDDTVAESAEIVEAVAEEQKPAPPKKKRKPVDISPLVRNFAACGRCSYFLAGYRVLVGTEGLETAVAEKKPNWLVLEWSHRMIDLVSRSYGIPLNFDNLSVTAICEECRRPFRLAHVGDDEPTTRFEIHFSPK